MVEQLFAKSGAHRQRVNEQIFQHATRGSAAEPVIAKGVVKDISVQDACAANDIDLMITSQDMSAAEETFFSCFKQSDGSFYGTYKDVLLRAVMEATMSAPTYFYPLERFVAGHRFYRHRG